MAADPRLQGIFTAIVTPLHADRQSVDTAALQRVIDHVLAAGSTGIVALGGTGEYTALANTERQRAIAATVEHVAGRAPVVVGIVSPGLGDARDAARYAEREGADYIMPVTPYYVHPTQGGIRGWFHSLAEVTSLPLVLYNIPSRTGVNITPETVLRLCDEIGRIAGIKECALDLGQVAELIRIGSDRLSILAGEEYYALAEFLLGARGAILASANAIPGHWVELFNATQAGRYEDAATLYHKIFPLLRAIFSETNPGPLKATLHELGLDVGPVANPLVDPSPATTESIRRALAELTGQPLLAAASSDATGGC